MEEQFHFPSMLYFDVNRHGCGRFSEGRLFFPLTADTLSLKYRGNILPAKSSIRIAQERENLGGKKKSRCRAANKLSMKRESRQREQLARAQQKKLSAWETSFLCYIISKAKKPLEFKERRSWTAKVTSLTGILIFIAQITVTPVM